MASYLQKPPVPEAATAADGTPPELRDIDYLHEVLQHSAVSTQAYLDTLIAKATDLGISVSRPSSSASTSEKRDTSGAVSNGTLGDCHVRAFSTGSRGSISTAPTSPSIRDSQYDFTGKILSKRRPRGLTFSQYETYLDHMDPNLTQPKFITFATNEHESSPSLFSVSTRMSYVNLKRGFSKIRRKRKSFTYTGDMVITCSACREDFQPGETIGKLLCGHLYCSTCLGIMINQATTDESKMPPRCCTQPIPGSIIKLILCREEQNRFLKAVLQYSTPWEARIFCCNPACEEFIPPRAKFDPKYPFQVMCRQCRTRVCVMCKRRAHPIGLDCPEDWELDAVLKMGEKSGWRRCFKCRTLVELTQGCTHMTCRCRAQFCYICGALWDPVVGCPNFCNGEEEMERRRQEEEARMAALATEEALKQEAAEREAEEMREAEQRTRNAKEFKTLRTEQMGELDRFQSFERKSKWLMWTRHAQQKLALVEKQSAMIDKMKERHVKTTANLEDRQVVAEMELRSTLEQSERNVRIRLKHMEAYCDGLGQGSAFPRPSRIVTERDLRELGQQYSVEKNMKQLHQAKINVMRDRQTKALEELVERQETEMSKLVKKNMREVENIELDFADEEDALATIFSQRRSTLETGWHLQMEIRRKELEVEKGVKYALPAPLNWPLEKESLEDSLSAVAE